VLPLIRNAIIFCEERVKLCFMDDLALYGDCETWKSFPCISLNKRYYTDACAMFAHKRDKLRSLGASRLINHRLHQKLLTAEKISLSFFSHRVSNCQWTLNEFANIFFSEQFAKWSWKCNFDGDENIFCQWNLNEIFWDIASLFVIEVDRFLKFNLLRQNFICKNLKFVTK
jgi:hypothetical protein